MLVQALVREDLCQLYQETVQTRTDADDQAITSISAVREALCKADGEIGQIRAEIRELARRRTDLEGARDRAALVDGTPPKPLKGPNPAVALAVARCGRFAMKAVADTLQVASSGPKCNDPRTLAVKSDWLLPLDSKPINERRFLYQQHGSSVGNEHAMQFQPCALLLSSVEDLPSPRDIAENPVERIISEPERDRRHTAP